MKRKEEISKCLHFNAEPEYEDHILLGRIYYGKRCKDCGDFIYPESSPIELGVYK
jgi:hypothetical protein